MRSGDKCPRGECSGRLYVCNSEPRADGSQLQRLCCDACGVRPSDNKVIVPAEYIRRRRFA